MAQARVPSAFAASVPLQPAGAWPREPCCRRALATDRNLREDRASGEADGARVVKAVAGGRSRAAAQEETRPAAASCTRKHDLQRRRANLLGGVWVDGWFWESDAVGEKGEFFFEKKNMVIWRL